LTYGWFRPGSPIKGKSTFLFIYLFINDTKKIGSQCQGCRGVGLLSDYNKARVSSETNGEIMIDFAEIPVNYRRNEMAKRFISSKFCQNSWMKRNETELMRGINMMFD
jgi:hypothetical protein